MFTPNTANMLFIHLQAISALSEYTVIIPLREVSGYLNESCQEMNNGEFA